MLYLAKKLLMRDAYQKGLNDVTAYCEKSVSSICCLFLTRAKSVAPAQDKTSLIFK